MLPNNNHVIDQLLKADKSESRLAFSNHLLKPPGTYEKSWPAVKSSPFKTDKGKEQDISANGSGKSKRKLLRMLFEPVDPQMFQEMEALGKSAPVYSFAIFTSKQWKTHGLDMAPSRPKATSDEATERRSDGATSAVFEDRGG